jgi:DNA-binding NtrC family response regulator
MAHSNEMASLGGRPRVVYVVDDDPILRELAALLVDRAGLVSRQFPNAEHALAAFKDAPQKPVMIISDYFMGGMNGLDLLTECKLLHNTLITVLVSGTVAEDILRHSRVEVDYFISKPYHPDTITEVLEKLKG